jgi:hypothetical protein
MNLCGQYEGFHFVFSVCECFFGTKDSMIKNDIFLGRPTTWCVLTISRISPRVSCSYSTCYFFGPWGFCDKIGIYSTSADHVVCEDLTSCFLFANVLYETQDFRDRSLNNSRSADHVVCVDNIKNFPSCFLFVLYMHFFAQEVSTIDHEFILRLLLTTWCVCGFHFLFANVIYETPDFRDRSWNNSRSADHVVCVDNIKDFTSCFLFSLELQHTIG